MARNSPLTITRYGQSAEGPWSCVGAPWGYPSHSTPQWWLDKGSKGGGGTGQHVLGRVLTQNPSGLTKRWLQQIHHLLKCLRQPIKLSLWCGGRTVKAMSDEKQTGFPMHQFPLSAEIHSDWDRQSVHTASYHPKSIPSLISPPLSITLGKMNFAYVVSVAYTQAWDFGCLYVDHITCMTAHNSVYWS